MKNHLGINECMNQACLGILCLETIQFGIFFMDAETKAQRGQLIYLRSEA